MSSGQESDADSAAKPTGGSAAGGAESPRILRSEDLFGGRREVWIEHGNEMYRLRITSAGRLYLSK